jgi:hypothetical protein
MQYAIFPAPLTKLQFINSINLDDIFSNVVQHSLVQIYHCFRGAY